MRKELSGILNVNKPKGWTSHDVVDRVRSLSGVRKVGHAGTLDPLATGVLLVCVGKATRVAQYLMKSRKLYRAVVRLGVSTDTYDAEGEVIRSVPEVNVTREEVKRALEEFKGVISQVPPMYSAVKVRGKRLYQLARRGEEVARQPRQVEIHDIRLVEWQKPFLTIEVECSPGTYIRSLAHDLGEKLGCGAYLVELVRLRSGRFSLEDAVTIEEIEEACAAGRLKRLLHPLDTALLDLPATTLERGEEKRIRTGQKVRGSPPSDGDGLYRAYSFDGRFLALVEWDSEAGLWQPRKVFV